MDVTAEIGRKARIRTHWWEFCSNCSHRAHLVPMGSEWAIVCIECETTLIVDELTEHRPE